MSRFRAYSILLFLAFLGAWFVPRLAIEADITHFLPRSEDLVLAELSKSLTSSDLNRTITLTLEASDSAQAASATKEMGRRLAEHPEIAWIRTGPDPSLERAFYDIYFSRRFYFYSGFPAEVFEVNSLREKIIQLKHELAAPTGTFVRRIAARDPLLFFLEHIQRLRGYQAGIHVYDGSFVTGENRQIGVVLAASRSSPFDSSASRRLQRAIEESFRATQVEHGGQLRLQQAGVHRIALRSEETIRNDIQMISTIGMVGVVLIILVLFRSFRLLFVAVLPLCAGVLVAIVTVQLLFGAIHGLTLAFGATLIGVALDYVAHLFSHLHLGSSRNPGDTVRRIWPGLLLGAATTITGLIGLALTSFPGVQQMAVFTSVGVAVALVMTRFVIPALLPASMRSIALHTYLRQYSKRFLNFLSAQRRRLWILPFLGVGIAVFGILRLSWTDDIRALNPLDAALLEEDSQVRQAVSQMDMGRFVVAFGENLEEALVRNDALYEQLEEAVEAGELDSFRSLHPLLASEQLQRERYEAFPDEIHDRVNRALELEGFIPERFGAFHEDLKEPFNPLRFEDVEETPLAPMIKAHRVSFERGEAILTFVHHIHDLPTLINRVESFEGIRFFDQATFMNGAYRTFRVRTLRFVLFGLGAVFVLVLLRYRRIGRSLAAFLPALIAAGATLETLGWLGISANLLHIVALLLVLSMGVDYGVFMVENESDRQDDDAATVVGLFIACLSTSVSFGALALSVNPALGAMGITVGCGVAWSFILAPTAWILFRSSRT